MARQVKPTLSDTGVGQGSNEAVLLLRTKEGRNHQGQEHRASNIGRIYVCNLISLYKEITLQNGMGPYMSHKLSIVMPELIRHPVSD
jgi:hypothetical protein